VLDLAIERTHEQPYPSIDKCVDDQLGVQPDAHIVA
jgi:hypothetical protein